MGFLDKFGRGVEDVAGRAKSRFSNDVEPIEIASKLRETMDKRAASFARDRSVVPNVFRIHLAPADFQRVVSWSQDEMARQMEEVATSHAADQGYSFVGPVEVTFVSDDSLGSPVEIDSSTRRGADTAAATRTLADDGARQRILRTLADIDAAILKSSVKDAVSLALPSGMRFADLGESGDKNGDTFRESLLRSHLFYAALSLAASECEKYLPY